MLGWAVRMDGVFGEIVELLVHSEVRSKSWYSAVSPLWDNTALIESQPEAVLKFTDWLLASKTEPMLPWEEIKASIWHMPRDPKLFKYIKAICQHAVGPGVRDVLEFQAKITEAYGDAPS